MNKNYFTYLMKSRKTLVFAVFLIEIAVSLWGIGSVRDYSIPSAMGICCVFTFLFCFAFPPIFLGFVHNKKAVDSYFSLGVSRKNILISSILFMFLSITLPLLVNGIMMSFGGVANLNYFRINYFVEYYLYMILVVICLLIANSAFYLLGNSSFDGIVMMGAYSLFAFFLMLVGYETIESFVYGYNLGLNLDWILYFSPFCNAVGSVVSIFDSIFSKFVNVDPGQMFRLITLLVITALCALVLYRQFVYRKAERAENISNHPLSYPLVIRAYTVITVFAALQGGGIDWFIYAVIVFVIFSIANFVFRRKIGFNGKDILFYLVVCGAVFLISFIGNHTDGFGLSRKYDRYPDDIIVTIYQGNTSAEIELHFGDKQKDKELYDLIERLRSESIEQHYKGNEDFYGSMYLTELSDDGESGRYYQYYLFSELTREDIGILNKYGDAKVSSVHTYYQ